MILYSISIAFRGHPEMTRRCVERVCETTDPKRTQILLYDNASPDRNEDLKHLLERHGHSFMLWRSMVNVGFGEAHNALLQDARGTYFVVLNNDVEVESGWLEMMRKKFLENPNVGQVGSARACCSLDERGIGQPGATRDYVEASCMMIPTYLAKRVGLFRPEYRFAYCEDADLSLRLRSQGFTLGYADLPIRHYGGKTTAAVRKIVDLEGFHRYNHELLLRRWDIPGMRTGRRILVRRSGARGDVLLTTPILRELRRKRKAFITVETDCPEVLHNNPDIFDVARPGEANPDDFHEFINLDGAYENLPGHHIVGAYAEVAKVGISDAVPTLRVSKDQRDLAAVILRGEKPWAIFHPGICVWPGRNWSPDRFDIVAKTLRDVGWSTAVVGDHQTPLLAGSLDLRNKTPATLLAAVMERARLFVGIDSFPMHVAQATLTPLVAVFGAIDPQKRLLDVPFFEGVTAPLKQCGCLGCHHVLEPPRTTGSCFRDRVLCMDELQPQAVLDAIDRVLRRRQVYLETSKIRDRVIDYCQGLGIDIGCGRDKICENAIGFDDDRHPEVDHYGDASKKMPYTDNHFAFVYSSHCLEDILDTEATLREWVRILRPGGHLILYVPHPEHYKGVNHDHKHPGFTPEQLEEFMQMLGMAVMESYVDLGPDRYSTVMVAKKP